MEKLDKADIKILKMLQNNSQLTIKEMAKVVNLSITPVHERIKRLENEGYIRKYAAILDRKLLGNRMMVYCQITLDKQIELNFKQFEESVSAFEEVLECSFVSGGYDYLLKIVVNDMEQYNTFYQTKLAVIQAVAHIHSFFVMKEIKNSHELPLG